ncbi:phytanoyl-CoA dioxygenase family protein [Paracraurococcus ruber]|nr:phytanoyl-CoA dioxygenase family protein [Paracraurococcus ruber]
MRRWARWLLAPVHLLALAGQAKSFEANPLLGSSRLNRLGLHLARRRLAARLGARRRARLAALLPVAERAAFDRDGYLAIPDFLPPAEFAALRAEILACRAPAREFQDGATLTRLIPLDGRALRHLPATRAALLGPRYLGLHAYAGSHRQRPHLLVQSVFSGVRDAPPDVQTAWHSDTFHPTVKSWLFLTEVAEDAAGFTYVPGSHRPTRRHLAWERRASRTAATAPDAMTRQGSLRVEEAVLARLGYPPPRKLAVAPNTLVIADTSGIHRRGIAAGTACRIAIWGYARGNPFWPWPTPPLPMPGFALRGFWAVQDAVARLTRRRGGWRWVGERTPDAPPAL